MNALIRKQSECEGLMAANETIIEAILASMREDLGEVKTDIRELRADNKVIREKLEQKTDAVPSGHLSLSAKIEAVNASLTTRMDRGFAATDLKIDALN